MMSEQQYRLEENNQTNELILWEDAKILNVFKSSYDNRKHLNIIVDRLNEQQTTINNQEQKIKILQQEINDTQAILGMLTEKLKGWNDE